MQPNAGLDFQRIVVTDTETFDKHSNIIEKLRLEHRLPEGRRTYEELLEKVGLKLEHDHEPRQTEQRCQQFVFQGQCLVLGDSGVGKTSLVRAITGKPFNEMESRTEGIEQSLVDEKWQNLDTKDLIFGSVNRFFLKIFFQVMLYGRAGNVIFQQSRFRKNYSRLLLPLIGLLFLLMIYRIITDPPKKNYYVFLIMTIFIFAFLFIDVCETRLVFSSKEDWRLKASLCCFMVNPYGILMGAFLSVVLLRFIREIYYVELSKTASFQVFLFVATATALGYVAFILSRGPQSFALEQKCPQPGQLKLNNQRPIEVIFFSRFILNTFVGFILATTVGVFYSKILHQVSIVMVIFYYLFFVVKTIPRILKSLPEWHQWAKLWSGIILLLCIFGCLPSSSERFAMTFMVLFCDTLHQEYFWLESAISTPSQDHVGPGMFTAVQLEKAVIDHKKLKTALNQKWSSLKLKILDFAGDKGYHAYFHMFLRSQAIYVIVFNMAEFAEDSLRDLTAKIKSLHFWLESVCSHVTSNTPILLVGTHRGNMERSTMERINENLKRNFLKLFCGELVLNKVDKLVFFPVENSLGQNDSGIQTFQRAIIATAEELKETIGRNIPLSWIQIQDALISMKSDKGAKVCVRFEEFPTVFDNFICTNWTEDTLEYFHEKGFMMYLNKEPKRVLLNPDILIDIIIRLVTKQPEGIPQRSCRHHWNLLQEKGLLTKFLLEFLLESVLSKVESKEDVTAFLEEHDLICPLTHKMAPINGERLAPTYFVPALLPICTDEKTLLWNDRSTDKKFFVFFKKFLPEPLFHCLLSRAHKNSKVQFWRSQPVVYRDAGRFWLDSRQPYRLKLLKDMKMIEVTFTRLVAWVPIHSPTFMIVIVSSKTM